MSDVAVKVEGLGKSYRIGQAKSGDFRESFGSWIDKIRGRTNSSQPEIKEFWALQGINFEIKKGQAVGIIGRNGAGKSTLLKILSRITEPTKGRFEINGRVSSLLEVGTGFHGELSGRENVYLNGTILGMKRREIKGKLDEIVAFSGVEKFIDTPVKHYSSGMKVRLAFSVAAHLEPEILIIDEVLAVGDAEFQKKCLGKMEDVTGQGRTVIFVSHNMGAVMRLCGRGIFLKNGITNLDGSVSDAINNYISEFDSEASDLLDLQYPKDDYLEFRNISVLQDNRETTNIQNSGEIHVRIEYVVNRQINAFQLFFDLMDGMGNIIFRTFHFDRESSLGNMPPLTKKGAYVSVAKIPKNFLVDGDFRIAIYAANMYERMIEPKGGIVINIKVEESGKYVRKMFGPDKGLVTPNIIWETENVSDVLTS